MSHDKPNCAREVKVQDLETYLKEVDHVTADMRRFAHKMRKIKSNLLGPVPHPSTGRS
jgi:hypothetical protein